MCIFHITAGTAALPKLFERSKEMVSERNADIPSKLLLVINSLEKLETYFRTWFIVFYGFKRISPLSDKYS